MNYTSLTIGAVITLYGVYVLYLRLTDQNEKFWKLQPMKDFCGSRLGSLIHYFGYVVVPIGIGIGISIILFGLNDLSIIDWVASR